MSEQRDPFFPRRVDESIEQLSSTNRLDNSAREQEYADPNARLIRDMQRLYGLEHERYLRALQRVEDRLVEQRITRDERPAAVPVISGGQQWSSSSRKIQGRLKHMENKQPTRMTRFGRRVSLLVAVLITALLVGSLVAVLSFTHRSTITASGPNGTPTTAPTQPAARPTPTISPTPGPANQGQVIYTSPISMDDFYAFAWSPDGKRVASSTNSLVQIWDATTGKHPFTFIPSGQGGSVLALSWSPNGHYLAVASGQVQIINPATGVVVRSFPSSLALAGSSNGSSLSALNPFSGGNMVYATAWSPDGTLMATALNGAVYGNIVDIWNVSTGQILYTFKGQDGREVNSLSWSPDGKYIASAGYDGTVQVWNARTGQVIFDQQASGLPYAAWAPTGMTLAFIRDSNTIEVWNVATNSKIISHSAPTNNDLAWSPDGAEIASGSGNNAEIWNAVTGKTAYTFTRQGGYLRTLAWSPDGRYIVSGSGGELGNNYAKVWVA